MTDEQTSLEEALRDATRGELPCLQKIENMQRLPGGASQEIWSLDGCGDGALVPLILRRAPGGQGVTEGSPGKITLSTEARLLSLAAQAGAPVPTVRYVLDGGPPLGQGYLMDRIEGETIARKILRDDMYAEVRPKLARQCGEVLAKIHTIATAELPELELSPAKAQWDHYRSTYDSYDYPHPVFELAFKWLDDHMLEDTEPCVVHGDFRNGNLIIGTDGVRAVLDWELAHLGDPMEDLAWVCVNSWRFGNIDHPVGGFGHREDLFEGYEAGGGTVDPERVRFWEIHGTMKWGIMCMSMYSIYETGYDRSVERAAIGRRSSETEIDLLSILMD